MWYINIEFSGFFGKKSTLRVCLGDRGFLQAKQLADDWIEYAQSNSKSNMSRYYLSYEKQYFVEPSENVQKKKTFLYKTSSKKRFRTSLPAPNENLLAPPTAYNQKGEIGEFIGMVDSFVK